MKEQQSNYRLLLDPRQASQTKPSRPQAQPVCSLWGVGGAVLKTSGLGLAESKSTSLPPSLQMCSPSAWRGHRNIWVSCEGYGQDLHWDIMLGATRAGPLLSFLPHPWEYRILLYGMILAPLECICKPLSCQYSWQGSWCILSTLTHTPSPRPQLLICLDRAACTEPGPVGKSRRGQESVSVASNTPRLVFIHFCIFI